MSSSSSHMESGARKVKNRRYDDDDDNMEMGIGWRVLYSLGMPLLYIFGILLGIVAIICNGILTSYWSDLDPPKCWLYAKTPSNSIIYKFGSSVSNCEWVTFGGVAAVVLLVICGIIYFAAVRGKGVMNIAVYVLMVLSLLSTLLMLAATCTLTEGLRVTCASMGLNPFNSRGVDCHDQLDLRVKMYNLSITSSTLIAGALYTYWPCTIIMFIITIFHLLSCYRRCYR
ncbi:hypothetical protein SK128_013271 [Halocaridina rubra]|uniref:Uncharacterized protein n=1 Tax=Halocaridina rubra TaxID=373956 RepID=A0AAN8XN35_HALRR